MDADPHPPRENVEHRRIRHARRQSPEQMQPSLGAAHFHFAKMPPQRPDQAIAALLIANLHSRETRAIAAATHHLGQRGLLEPGIAVVEQRFRSTDGLGDARRRGDEAEPQPGPERLRRCRDKSCSRAPPLRPPAAETRHSESRCRNRLRADSSRCVAPTRRGALCGRRRGRIRSGIDATASDIAARLGVRAMPRSAGLPRLPARRRRARRPPGTRRPRPGSTAFRPARPFPRPGPGSPLC